MLTEDFQNKAVSCTTERFSKIKANKSVGLLKGVAVEQQGGSQAEVS